MDIQSFAHLSALEQLEISWQTMLRAWSADATNWAIRSKKQERMIYIFLVVVLWQLRKSWNSCLTQPHLRGRGWTNLSPLFNDWDDIGSPPHHFELLGVTLDIYLRELLSHRGEVLSGLRIFYFWKRSVSPSFRVFFLCVLVCFWLGCFAAVLLFFWNTPGFCPHLFSN